MDTVFLKGIAEMMGMGPQSYYDDESECQEP